MNNVKRLKKAGKAAAGSALLVGATLTGAAGFAAASSHTGGDTAQNQEDMELGGFPAPFVNSEGQVNTAIAVGADAGAPDVVGATNIAGSLGNQAFTTETVSAGGGNFGFTATGGVTLSTQNDDLYFGESLTEVRDTLTEDQLDSLTETTFQDDSGEETDVENFLFPNQALNTQFGKPDDRDNQDPVHYVRNPSDPDPSTGDYLFQLQANFEDSIDFTADDVQDEDIELFGQTYTVSTDIGDNSGEDLVLNGAREQVSVSTGEESSTTVTVDGEEVTLEVIGVTGTNTAAISVNGEVTQEQEDDEFTVNGQTIRIGDIIQTNSDNSQGTVQFEVGSQQLVIPNGGGQVEDEDGDDIEGLFADFPGDDATAVSTINYYVGAQDDDREYVLAGETYTHDLLPDYSFNYGGLNPDTSTGDAEESTSTVEFTTSGDETVTANLDGESVEFLHAEGNNYDANTQVELRDDDNDVIHSYEGAVASEDEYFAADAGDFPHLFEVTNIDRDETGNDIESGSEATVDLRDAVTGDTIEVDLDAAAENDFSSDNNGGDSQGRGAYYADTEIIDGQTYKFVLEGDDDGDDTDTNNVNSGRDGDTIKGNTGEPELQVVFGDGSRVSEGENVPDIGNNLNPGDEITNFAALDTDSNAAVSLYQVHNPAMPFTESFGSETVTGASDLADATAGTGVTVEIPSTESTDAVTREVSLGDAEAVTSNGGLTHSFGFVPGEGTTLGEFQTDSNSDLKIDDTGTSTGSTYDVSVLYADGSTQSATSVGDSGGAGTTVDLDDGKTVVSIAVDTGQGEDGDTVQVQTASGGSLTDYDTVGDIRADNKVRAVASGDQLTSPAAFTIEPEDDNDNEEAYIVGASVDTDDDELDTNFVDFTGDRQSATLESNDDIDAGVDFFGTYSEIDSDEQGSVTLELPSGQAVAGAAFTTEEGSLEMGGSAGSVETMSPTGYPANALLDEEVSESARQSRNMVLVGGPAVNDLVADLAEANKTLSASEYTEGEAIIDYVPDAFSEGNAALVVAGFSSEDTRYAARQLSQAEDGALPDGTSLSGKGDVTLTTQ